MPDHITRFRSELRSIAAWIGKLHELMHEHQENNRDIVECLDFALLHGTLYSSLDAPDDDLADGIENHVRYIGREILRLNALHQAESEFSFVLSLPTIYETARSLIVRGNKLLRQGEQIAADDRLYDQLMQQLDKAYRGANDHGKPSQQLASIINGLEHVNDTSGLKRFEELVTAGNISGLGSYFTVNDFARARPALIDNYQSMLVCLNTYRRRRHGESDSLFKFRNSIDAMNFGIGSAFQTAREDVFLSFSGPLAHSVRRAEVRRITETRTPPGTLLVRLKGLDRSKRLGFGDIQKGTADWTLTVQKAVEEALQIISHVQSIDELRDQQKYLFESIYTEHLSELWHPGSVASTAARSSQPGSRTDFKHRFSAAGEAMKGTARTLFKLQPIIEADELLEFMDVEEDPHFKQVNDQLGRKSR